MLLKPKTETKACQGRSPRQDSLCVLVSNWIVRSSLCLSEARNYISTDCCWIDGLIIYFVIYQGEEGVREVLQILNEEFCLSMALSGQSDRHSQLSKTETYKGTLIVLFIESFLFNHNLHDTGCRNVAEINRNLVQLSKLWHPSKRRPPPWYQFKRILAWIKLSVSCNNENIKAGLLQELFLPRNHSIFKLLAYY